MPACKFCGAETTPEDRYCPGCGKRNQTEGANRRGSTQGVVTLSDVQFKLSMVYFKKGEYARAADACRQVLKDQPGHPEAMRLLQAAEAQLKKGGGS